MIEEKRKLVDTDTGKAPCKPRIFLADWRVQRLWECRIDYDLGCTGYGRTPREAFEQWRQLSEYLSTFDGQPYRGISYRAGQRHPLHLTTQ